MSVSSSLSDSFVEFVCSLPDEKLLALAKPFGSDRKRSVIIQAVMDKFGNMGWERFCNRLPTTTLQRIASELAVENGDHDDRALLLRSIPLKASSKTHESIASLSKDLIEVIWNDLSITESPDVEGLIMELFIGGLEAVVGLWTIPQMTEIIQHYSIESRGHRLKDDIVFDIVKSILENNYKKVESETQLSMDSVVPPTPRSPIRPSSSKRRPQYSHRGKLNLEEVQNNENQENVDVHHVTEAVGGLNFGSPRRSLRR